MNDIVDLANSILDTKPEELERLPNVRKFLFFAHVPLSEKVTEWGLDGAVRTTLRLIKSLVEKKANLNSLDPEETWEGVDSICKGYMGLIETIDKKPTGAPLSLVTS